ncbi:hypothetical protein ABPG75_007781 [Micractinium tetrahymenae]
MAQPESDDLSQLMPNLRQRAQAEAASPANTAALREYIKVLGEKPSNLPAASTLPHKPRIDGLAPRSGSGRRPHRRYFTIKLRPVEPDAEALSAAEAAEAAALDPEALKDALVQQARAQRQALLEASRRPGTGRMPCRREFTITLPLLPTEEELAAEAEAEVAAAAAAAAAEDEAAAAEAAAAAELQAHLVAQEAEAQQWEGMLAEHAAAAREPRLATAGSPGAALRSPSLQLEQGGSCEAAPGSVAAALPQQQEPLEPATSQRGQARTPGTSLYGRYTPMEGVPERLALLATRGKAAPGVGAALATAAASPLARPAGTPAGFTPLEGIPERLLAFPALPGASRLGSNAGGRPSVDSPVEGLVLEGAARRRGSTGAAPARLAGAGGAGDFDGFAPSPQAAQAAAAPHAPSPGALPAPAALLEQQAAQQAATDAAAAAAAAADDDFDDDMGGNFDDGGYYDEEPLPAGGAGDDHLHMADAGVQTGASLDAEAAVAAAAGGSPGVAADAPADYGYDGGFDDGCEGGEFEDADAPETSAAAHRRARRQTKNPGARLRNELKRKSLAADPHIGRHEVLPGVRRSSRQKQEPLKWWLNEKKEFGRSHKTMPTVNNVVHKVPNTPWQTVTDIKRRPTKKQRAPTPHDLEDALAGAEPKAEDAAAAQSEGEEEEQEQQEEQQQQAEEQQEAAEVEGDMQQQRRPGSGGRGQAAQPQRQKQQPRRQARAAAAEPPAPRAKATKRAAAGGGRKRKARR